jgi:hypothetical protein
VEHDAPALMGSELDEFPEQLFLSIGRRQKAAPHQLVSPAADVAERRIPVARPEFGPPGFGGEVRIVNVAVAVRQLGEQRRRDVNRGG